MPHIARVGGMLAAAGFAGHGVAMATYAGALIAAQLRGTPMDNPFAEIPFRGAPGSLRAAVKWGLPVIAAWYKLQDLPQDGQPNIQGLLVAFGRICLVY